MIIVFVELLVFIVEAVTALYLIWLLDENRKVKEELSQIVKDLKEHV